MANKLSQKSQARIRRRKHFLKKYVPVPGKYRLVVHRSNKHIYAQLVDDLNHVTVLSASSQSKELAKKVSGAKKVDQAKEVGKLLAELAAKQKIENVVFDRAGYLYHGRVKALAEGAREGGLKF